MLAHEPAFVTPCPWARMPVVCLLLWGRQNRERFLVKSTHMVTIGASKFGQRAAISDYSPAWTCRMPRHIGLLEQQGMPSVVMRGVVSFHA